MSDIPKNISELGKGDFIWATVNSKEMQKAKIPSWKRTAAIDMNGDVLAPGGLVDNESCVMMKAGFDGERVVIDNKHPYFSVRWLAKEYPDWANVMEAIENRMKLDFCSA